MALTNATDTDEGEVDDADALGAGWIQSASSGFRVSCGHVVVAVVAVIPRNMSSRQRKLAKRFLSCYMLLLGGWPSFCGNGRQ